MKVAGKVAWVTGASTGIGQATALELAARGAFVVLTARRKERLQDVRNRCPDPALAAVLPADLIDFDALPSVVEQASRLFSRIDLVVHNAGVGQRGAVVETELAVHRRVFDLNYFAPVAIDRLVLPAMLERGAGQLAYVASLAGKVSTPQRCAYNASKRALLGYADSVRVELADQGIEVTSLCPGFVKTDFAHAALTGDGTPWAQSSPSLDAGLEPELLARRFVDGIEAGKRELLVGGREVHAATLAKVAPGLVDRVIRRVRTT